ncbi:MAG: transferrin-binding protein-like solute binding protein [Alphaproteobacteria bacterium]|nr:transferrin-binding protein-like solute binding protein [Alphaproteobacteria bacterium]
MKNIGKYLLATTVLIGLAACQTTSSSTMSIAQGVATTPSQTKAISLEVDIKQNDDGGLTAIIDGKTYEFSKADLDAERTRPRYDKDLTDGSHLTVRRQGAGTSEHSELWRVQLRNDEAKTADLYFLAIGEKTEKPPTTGTASYRGGLELLLRDKAGDSDVFKYVYSDLDLDVDFATGTLSGQTSEHELYANGIEDSVEFNGAVVVSNGKITGNQITADLKSDAEFDSNMGLATSVTGTLDGNFFGYYGSEIKGTGILSNDLMIGTVGFGVDSN